MQHVRARVPLDKRVTSRRRRKQSCFLLFFFFCVFFILSFFQDEPQTRMREREKAHPALRWQRQKRDRFALLYSRAVPRDDARRASRVRRGAGRRIAGRRDFFASIPESSRRGRLFLLHASARTRSQGKRAERGAFGGVANPELIRCRNTREFAASGALGQKRRRACNNLRYCSATRIEYETFVHLFFAC